MRKSVKTWIEGLRSGRYRQLRRLYLESKAENEQLKWKEEAMRVVFETDYQRIGEELGLAGGDNIAAKILPTIKSLKKQIIMMDAARKP